MNGITSTMKNVILDTTKTNKAVSVATNHKRSNKTFGGNFISIKARKALAVICSLEKTPKSENAHYTATGPSGYPVHSVHKIYDSVLENSGCRWEEDGLFPKAKRTLYRLLKEFSIHKETDAC